MIPKSHQANKWCLTVDLSFLKGRSINDSIPKHLCSLKYISIDNAVQKILSQGRVAILAKIDVKSAFVLLPVHPSDRHLLGMSWNKALYVDNCLQFCLHSAPKLFNLLADLLAWVLEQVGLLQQNPQDYDNLMMWAACCIAFYGFLRCSEFTMPSQQEYDPQVHLQYADAAVDCRNNPRMLMVWIKQSKMDPFRQGVTLCLGKTDCAVCPVTGILPYLMKRGPRYGPLFITSKGAYMTRQSFHTQLSTLLVKQASHKTIQHSQLQNQGRLFLPKLLTYPMYTYKLWAGGEATPISYSFIKTPPIDVASFAKIIAQQCLQKYVVPKTAYLL